MYFNLELAENKEKLMIFFEFDRNILLVFFL